MLFLIAKLIRTIMIYTREVGVHNVTRFH